jgi:translocation and assembly module TamB
VNADGTVRLPEGARTTFAADAEVRVEDLDASVVVRGAPRSRLSAVIDASVVARSDGGVEGRFDVQTRVGEVGGRVVPAAHARGVFTERSVRGAARIAEPGAPTRVELSLGPGTGDASPDQLAIRIETRIADLAEVKSAGRLGHGRAHLVVDGRVDLRTKEIDARAAADLGGVDVKGVRLARGFIRAAAGGALDAPRLDIALRGGGLHAGGYAFTGVDVRATGSTRDLTVAADLAGDDRAPTVSGRAHVAFGEAIALFGTSVRLARGDVESTLEVASIRAAGGVVDVQGARVLGLGDPIEGWARISASRVAVRGRSEDVDLARVAKLVAREEDARGHVALDVDAVASRRGAEGRVDLRARDLALRGVAGASGWLSASVRGEKVRGELHASLGDAGRIDLATAGVALGGAATEVSAWERATGSLTVDGDVDLARLLAKLPAERRPVEAAQGRLILHGKVSRSSSSASPALDLAASTSDLALVGKGWHTQGLDGDVTVTIDDATGRTQVSARLHDARGALASVEARATLPVAHMLEAKGRLAGLLMDLPMEATVDVPRQSLDAMPLAFGLLPLRGDVELDARLAGTARAPRIAIAAKGTNLVARDAATCVRPVDLTATLAYDGQQADVRVGAARDGRRVMDAGATVWASAAHAIAGGPLPWEASATIDLAGFPLDAVGAVAGRPITGELSGRLEVADLHRAASLEADLDLRSVTLDRAEFPRGEIHVGMKEGAFDASARLEQTDGSLVTQAKGAMSWGEALVPSLDPARPVDLSIRAKNFRANAAAPFVTGIFGEIDGRVDADATVHVEHGGKDGAMNGSVTLREGVIDVPRIGERFHGVTGRLIMRPWGTLRFEDVSASASTGKLEASAVAVLRGLSLQRADARVHVAKGESIPVAVEGVPLGRASGDVEATARMSDDGKRLDAQVDVPTLHVDLPQVTGHAVQSLAPDPTIRVGAISAHGFAPFPLASPSEPRAPSDLAVHVAVKLGDDVVIERQGALDVAVTGELSLDVTDRAHLAGRISVVRGTIQLQNRQFVIDHGAVSFVGPDPSDPTVVASAYWDGPEGTRVFADFDGRVSSGRLRLRSEPELSQDEILALVLFGAPDGAFGAEGAPGLPETAGMTAAGMAGGILAQGLNKAISGITGADVTTRVDTSQAGNPRPELDMQLSKSISARLGYRLGVPAPGENPDRTELTIEWRFIRNFSLTAVIGDQGSTSLNVVWRLRY